MGQSPKAADVNTDAKGLPLLNGPTEFGPDHPAPVQFTTSPVRVCQKGDLLFCVRGSTTGRMNWADQAYAIGRGIAAIRHKNGEAFQPLLRAVIEQELDDLLVQATGSTFPNVSARLLGGIRWPDLDARQQESVSAFLGACDQQIQLTREIISALSEITSTIYKAWFVDFLPLEAKQKGATSFRGMPQALFDELSDSYDVSEIGPIPKNWRLVSLKSLSTELRRGISPAYTTKRGVLVLNQKCIRNQRVNFALARRHDPQSRGIEGREIQLHDIIVNSTGVGTLGRAAQIYDLKEATIIDTHLTVVRPNKAEINPIYLGFEVTSKEANIEALGRGSTGQTELNRDELGAMPTLVPPPQFQCAFAKVVSPFIAKAVVLRQQLETMQTLRSVAAPRLILAETLREG